MISSLPLLARPPLVHPLLLLLALCTRRCRCTDWVGFSISTNLLLFAWRARVRVWVLARVRARLRGQWHPTPSTHSWPTWWWPGRGRCGRPSNALERWSPTRWPRSLSPRPSRWCASAFCVCVRLCLCASVYVSVCASVVVYAARVRASVMFMSQIPGASIR